MANLTEELRRLREDDPELVRVLDTYTKVLARRPTIRRLATRKPSSRKSKSSILHSPGLTTPAPRDLCPGHLMRYYCACTI
jgi:hypothetical protein